MLSDYKAIADKRTFKISSLWVQNLSIIHGSILLGPVFTRPFHSPVDVPFT